MGWLGITAIVMTAASTAMQAMSAASQADAQRKQYNYQADSARVNSEIATQNAKAVEDAGRSAEQRQRVITSQQVGQMRAEAGASGFDVGSDTLVEGFAGQTATGEVDALNVRNNYQREANQSWQQAQQFKDQAAWYSSAASNVDATGQILGITFGGIGQMATVGASFGGTPPSAGSPGGTSIFGVPASSTDVSGLTLRNASLRAW